MPSLPWNLQWYLIVPTAVKRRVKDCPGFRVPEFQCFEVDVCWIPELTFFHLIRSPLWIVMVMGMNRRLLVIFTTLVTEAEAGGALAVLPAKTETASTAVIPAVASLRIVPPPPGGWLVNYTDGRGGEMGPCCGHPSGPRGWAPVNILGINC